MYCRTKGVQNLGNLFPNLAVIRGIQLYKDYALVIFDNEHLEVSFFYILYETDQLYFVIITSKCADEIIGGVYKASSA